MKEKRPKNPNFPDFTKNEGKKQDEKFNFYKKNENNHTASMAFSNHTGMNDFFSKSESAAGSKDTTRDEASALLFDTDGGLGPDYTYQSKNGLGSGHTYKREEEERTYLYGFTNSKFIYFLGTMEPRAYLIFVTLIALLILEDLNNYESKIIYFFISNVANTMQPIIEQEIIANSYYHDVNERRQGDALQKDFELLYSEIDRLKKEISHLKS